MGDAAKRRATYEDVLAAPGHVVAEVVHGVLHTQPRPAAPHTRAATRLGVELGGPFDRGRGPGGWVILDEPELHLGEDIVVPDIEGWRRSPLSWSWRRSRQIDSTFPPGRASRSRSRSRSRSTPEHT